MAGRKQLPVDASTAAKEHETHSGGFLDRVSALKDLFVRAFTDDNRSVEQNVRSLELFISYFIEERNRMVHRPPQFANRADFFNDFVGDRTNASPVALIGAGKMGSALLESWIGLGLQRELIVVVEPRPSKELIDTSDKYKLRLLPDLRQLAPAVSVLFLAIKPQDADSVLPYLSKFVGNTTLLVSIMAGKSIHVISTKIKRRAAVVRAMPNIAASIGRGVTAAVANDMVQQKHRDLAFGLLRATGPVEWIENEDLMDAVTAVSGSGPAYVFLLTEMLARAGAAAGLPDQLASKLARETVAGSGELLHRSALDAAALRKSVTSSGGTTAAALNVLMGAHGLEQLLTEAVAAATKRSRELAG